MKRTLAIIGAAALAVTGAVAMAQAQGPDTGAEQQAGRPAFDQAQRRTGPPRQGMGQGQGMGQRQGQGLGRGQGAGRGPQGAMRGPGGRGRGGPGRGGAGMALRGLDLTEAQRAQIKAIHEKVRQDVEGVLTPEQLAKLKNRRGGGGAGNQDQ